MKFFVERRMGQPIPIEQEPFSTVHMENAVQQAQPLRAGERFGCHAQPLEVVQDVVFDTLQPGFAARIPSASTRR